MCGTSDKTKVNCQCDGNCDCGKVMPDGTISCDNCGWKAKEAYNSLTGNQVCPSCRTESPYSNDVKPKNNEMNQQTSQTRDNLSNGLVGLATTNSGFLNWSKDPMGKNNGVNNTESNFANDISSQNMVGFGAGQPWMVMNPFNGKDPGAESNFAEDVSSQNMVGVGINQDWMMMNPFGTGKKQLTPKEQELAKRFYAQAKEFDMIESNYADESGMGGNLGNFVDKVKDVYHKATPSGLIIRETWAGKYCKSLGYMKGSDKTAFTKCKNATKINFVKAKKGEWTYPAAPAGAEETIDLDALAAATQADVESMPPEMMAARLGEATPAKSNAMLYGIIGLVLLIIIVAIIIFYMRMKSAKAA